MNQELDDLRRELCGIDDLTNPEQCLRRLEGHDYPEDALTMIGYHRLYNVQKCIETIVRESIPGDVMECGVWRGGACILMAKTLDALDDQERICIISDNIIPSTMIYKAAENEAAMKFYDLSEEEYETLKGYKDFKCP